MASFENLLPKLTKASFESLLPLNEETTILFNPNSSTPIYFLDDAKKDQIKNIHLAERSFAIIIETNYGSIWLHPSNPYVSLIYKNRWVEVSDDRGIKPIWIPRKKRCHVVSDDYIGSPQQGSSVSFSADGKTLAIGGFNDNNGIGAVWIYNEIEKNTWSQDQKLICDGGLAHQGFSVSLSGDGNTLAIGGPKDSSWNGAVWIWVRNTENLWIQQGEKLVGSDSKKSKQGWSVSLSYDGNTLAVGGPGDSNNKGKIWIWVRKSLYGTWKEQQSFVGSGALGPAAQGTSVSISADGNTVAFGGPDNNGMSTGIGATWIWTRGNLIWKEEAASLIGDGMVGYAFQGQSVSLSADGNTLAVGGPTDNGGIGATWIFKREPATKTWSQYKYKLVGYDIEPSNKQGSSVCLSNDGELVAIGSYCAIWLFCLSSKFPGTQIGKKLIDKKLNFQGTSISLSSNRKMVIGAPNGIGASAIFF